MQNIEQMDIGADDDDYSNNNKIIDELWIAILDYLEYKDIFQVGLTSRSLNEISKRDVVWRNACVRYFKLTLANQNDNTSCRWYDIYRDYVMHRHFVVGDGNDNAESFNVELSDCNRTVVKGSDFDDTIVVLNTPIPFQHSSKVMNQAIITYQFRALCASDYAFDIGILCKRANHSVTARTHIGNDWLSLGINNCGFFWCGGYYQLITDTYNSGAVTTLVVNCGESYLDYYLDGCFQLRLTDIFSLHSSLVDKVDDENDDENEMEEEEEKEESGTPEYYMCASILLDGDSIHVDPIATQPLQPLPPPNERKVRSLQSWIRKVKDGELSDSEYLGDW
jgi:hypothetical protein